jgi:hypothetical protein
MADPHLAGQVAHVQPFRAFCDTNIGGDVAKLFTKIGYIGFGQNARHA